jgi:hypothetical protein
MRSLETEEEVLVSQDRKIHDEVGGIVDQDGACRITRPEVLEDIDFQHHKPEIDSLPAGIGKVAGDE